MLAARGGPADVCLTIEVEVLARAECPSRIFWLARLPGNQVTPWATWESYKGKPTECYHGHWFEWFEDAVADLEDRSGQEWSSKLMGQAPVDRPYMGLPGLDRYGFQTNQM